MRGGGRPARAQLLGCTGVEEVGGRCSFAEDKRKRGGENAV